MDRDIRKKVTALIAAVMLTACASGSDTAPAGTAGADVAPVTDSAADNSAADSSTTVAASEDAPDETDTAEDGGIKAVFGEIRTEFATVDLSDYPLTPSDVPEGYSEIFEAESGTVSGNVYVSEREEASGGAYVSGLNVEGDRLDIPVTVGYDGAYDINVLTGAASEGRENYVLVDGEQVGTILTTGMSPEFEGSVLYDIYLTKGEHTISLEPYWGYIEIDCVELRAPEHPITADTYKVKQDLSNANADEHTRALYKFLSDIYGKYSLAGQYAEKGRESSEFTKIKAKTGKEFAVLGRDMSGYSLCSQGHGSGSKSVEYAYDWYNNAGGIVQLCWHWTSPDKYVKSGQPWYSSFYADSSDIDLDAVMNGQDEECYQLLMDDIDNMSDELARLRDAGVPVLWRPLHEASGGWFWWGDCQPETYKKLWNVMYDKMTNEHGLTNLIWVWNGQSPDWYPGDETVDIVGWDIYAGKRVDSSQAGRFADMAVNYGDTTKLIALTENGCVMDPDKVMRDNARWLFWGTWSDPFTMKLGVVVNDEYTTYELLEKAYCHDRVLTLDELPDLKNYK